MSAYFQCTQAAQREDCDWLKNRKTYYVGRNGLSHVVTLPVQKRNNIWAITTFWAIM